MGILAPLAPFLNTVSVSRAMAAFKDIRVIKAIKFASEKHEGQVRKLTGEPYVSHPIAVAWAVAHFTDDIEVIIAAILHDVVEDCYEDDYEKGFREITVLFCVRVAMLVRSVTKLTTKADGTRAERAIIENTFLNGGSEGTHLIKTCDIYHNCHNVQDAKLSFSKRYLPSKITQISFLQKAPQLLTEACLAMLNNRLEYVLQDAKEKIVKIVSPDFALPASA